MVRPDSYRMSPAMAQSDVKLFAQDIVTFHHEKILGNRPDDDDKAHFDLGSLVDAHLLDKESLSRYYVMTTLKAKGKVKEVLDKTWQMAQDDYNRQLEYYPEAQMPKLTDCLEFIQKAVTICEYQTNWTMDTRVNTIIEKGRGYWGELEHCVGKKIVTLNVWNQAEGIVSNLKDDLHTADIFAKLSGDLPEGWEVYKQLELYAFCEEEDMKGLLDFVFIDHINKVIYPWDLKTSRTLAKFRNDYREYRYGLQGAYYSFLLEYNYPTYRIEPFSFLVVPTESLELPERFQMTRSELYFQENGGTVNNRGYVPGFRALLSDIHWHREKGLWAHRRSYYEKGVNLLESYFLPDVVDEQVAEVDF